MTKSSQTAAPRIDPDKVGDQFESLIDTSIVWLHAYWKQILIAAGIAVLIALLLMWIRSLGPRLERHSKSGKGWPAVFGRSIGLTNNFFIATLSARMVSGVASTPAQVDRTIATLFTIAAAYQVAVWAREITLGAIERRTRGDHYGGEALMSALGLIRVLVSFAVFAIATVVVLDNLGINVTGLVAGLGVGGIAIGLAAQGIFADLFAALAIIFDRPFRRGDAIAYDQTSGTVEEIGLKSTRIRGVNGEERIIANKQLLDKEIQNNTRRERRRTKFTLGLAYETPPDVLDRFPQMVKEAIEGAGMVYIRCGFFQFGPSSLDFDIEFDSESADFQAAYDGRHKVGVALLKRCNEEGISIPYPTQTTFTAAPDGRLIMPYSDHMHLTPPPEAPAAG